MQAVYFISGLGANRRVFDYLLLEKELKPRFIEWKIPEKNETLPHYAERMAEAIAPKEAFSLVGLSFGGILAQEMNRYVQPEQTVLISSIKSNAELPRLMRFSAKTGAHKLLSTRFLTGNSLFSYRSLRKLYYRNPPDWDDFFTHRDPYYLKWSIHQILHWENTLEVQNLSHLHGTRDQVFPTKYIENAVFISGGTHLMILQKAKAVSAHLNRILNSRTTPQFEEPRSRGRQKLEKLKRRKSYL